VKKFFAVPGDYNLILLDKLIEEPRLEFIGNCNELNCAYAADGYSRATKGLSVCVVTYMVGGLSAINGIAGAYSDDLPVLLVSGGPNTNDAPTGNVVHHTTGHKDFYQQIECFKPVVAGAYNIRHVDDAPSMIDKAISQALATKKPVYLEIACNLAGQKIKSPNPLSVVPSIPASDPASLAAALEAAVNRITSAVKPTLLGGVKMRTSDSQMSFQWLANSLGCAVAVMPDAKGHFPEAHPQFIGTYWGTISSPHTAEVVESSDLVIIAGPLFNDFTTTGWSSLIGEPAKTITIGLDYVDVGGQKFHNVYMNEFIMALSQSLPQEARNKDMSLIAYKRFVVPEEPPVADDPNSALTLRELRRQVQGMLKPNHDLIVETGDSWFNGQKLTLPEGATYHFQCQYGSIGWSVGAALGYQLGTAPGRRVIALTGDGSFQLTAQEISVAIREKSPVIMFLLNNRGYTIEVEIHDGPYNNIKNWDYAKLVDAFNAEDGKGISFRVDNGAQLAEAIKKAEAHNDFVLIECTLHRDDCTEELLEWGSRVATAGGRPPINFKQFK
jgi:TPP-dependent 2-oxoacid decarboxylase